MFEAASEVWPIVRLSLIVSGMAVLLHAGVGLPFGAWGPGAVLRPQTMVGLPQQDQARDQSDPIVNLHELDGAVETRFK